MAIVLPLHCSAFSRHNWWSGDDRNEPLVDPPGKTDIPASREKNVVLSGIVSRGRIVPTPADSNHGSPKGPLHVIAEEWLYDNVES